MLKTWLPVLVVDDSQTMCAIMKRILFSLGFSGVQDRQTAFQAIRELHNRDYGFILCDIEMKPVDGMEFVRRIRRDKFLRDIPVILTTAQPARLTKRMGEGEPFLADGFIGKPFTASDLKTKLSEVLEASFQNKMLLPDHLARLNGFEAAS